MIQTIKFFIRTIKSVFLFVRPALWFPVKIISFYRLAKRFHLFYYNIALFMPLYHFSTLKGKSVLEVGGSNLPRELIFGKFKARQWICLDYLDWWVEGVPDFEDPDGVSIYSQGKIHSLEKATPELLKQDHVVFNGMADELPECFHEKFDMAVSICAMEHIGNLAQSVEKIYQSLKPGGAFYACFAPIWSGPKGNHFWIGDADSTLNFNGIPGNGVPEYAHLLKSEEELRKLLADRYPQETVDEICRQTYHSNFINRLFFEDYERIFRESSFQSVEIQGWLPGSLSSRCKAELKKRYPGYEHFEYSGLVIFAKK